MSIRMRRPETVRISLTQDDWILVRKHLTAGETRAIYARMIRYSGNGAELDPVLVGHSKIIGYLIDWSIQDADGKPVAIQGQPENVVAAAIDALDADSFAEILKAVEAHETQMEQERERQKTTGRARTYPQRSRHLPRDARVDVLGCAGSPTTRLRLVN